MTAAVCHINLARGFRGGERQTELLIRQLAALAWLADGLPPRGREAPFRYDLGGDPWARYRAALEETEDDADEDALVDPDAGDRP